MAERKGFVSTLESVLASTIFLIFIINVLPAFTSQPVDTDNTIVKMRTVLNSLDESGVLRQLAVEREVSSIESELQNYFSEDLAVGLTYVDRIDGSYSGGETRSFDTNVSRLRTALLKVWVDGDSGVTFEVNGRNVLESVGSGYHTADVTPFLQEGSNTLSILGSENGRFVLDTYNHVQGRNPPTDTDVRGVGYRISGGRNGLNMTEVSVLIW